MGRLVRKPQVPDLDSQAAGFRRRESGTAGTVAVKAEPGDGYLERMVEICAGRNHRLLNG